MSVFAVTADMKHDSQKAIKNRKELLGRQVIRRCPREVTNV